MSKKELNPQQKRENNALMKRLYKDFLIWIQTENRNRKRFIKREEIHPKADLTPKEEIPLFGG